MKKVLLVLVLVVVGFSSSFAQLFSAFRMDEGYQSAYSNAVAKLGANCKFRAAAAVGGDFNVVKPKFNLDNGKCELWVYVFEMAGKSDSLAIIPFVKTILGGYVNVKDAGVTVPIDQYLSFLPNSVVTAQYVKSDAAATSVKNNADYTKFITANSSSTVSFFVLGNNEKDSKLIIGDAYWNATITDGIKTLNCSVHSVTQETVCAEPKGAEIDYEYNKFVVYPNPSSQYIYISLNEDMISNLSSAEIVDANGMKVMDISFSLQNQNGQINIPLTMLNNGMYFLKMNANNKVYLEKFNVLK